MGCCSCMYTFICLLFSIILPRKISTQRTRQRRRRPGWGWGSLLCAQPAFVSSPLESVRLLVPLCSPRSSPCLICSSLPCILPPALGVVMRTGLCNKDVAICILLTILGQSRADADAAIRCGWKSDTCAYSCSAFDCQSMQSAHRSLLFCCSSTSSSLLLQATFPA